MTRSERAEQRKAARRSKGLTVRKDPSKTRAKSLAPIAELLDCEGFNEYAANVILKWARLNGVGDVTQTKTEMGELLKDYPVEVKKAVGRAVSRQGKALFAAGVRLGLMSYITLTEGDCKPPQPGYPGSRAISEG